MFIFIVCNNKKKSRKIIISNIVAVISVTSKIHIRLLVVNIYHILFNVEIQAQFVVNRDLFIKKLGQICAR